MSTYTQENHSASLARSNSFFGAIRNIVTAPFAWFAGSEDEFEDTKGKRRRLPVVPEDVHMEDESTPSRAKRQRISSPDRHPQPYLDPPRSAFAQLRRTSDHSTISSGRGVARSPRKTLHLPSTSNQLPRNRRTVSPLPSGPHFNPQGITRTMSLDPPSHASFSSRLQRVPTIQDLQSETNHTGNSMPTSRDVSLSPRHLRVRSSLTPQPSGTAFGPVVPPRRERGPDEPPPLSTLMSNPKFVKPPAGAQKLAAEPPQQLTLGTLVDSQRTARAPAHQSSILFGTGSMTDVSAPGHLWPLNKAEIALHELEVYKTPLLPTRLKGAPSVPDIFMHKEKKHITLMTDDRPVKPRLGTKGKGKEKGKKKERETTNGTKPYAGEGGMKKWLARRKKEEEEAKEKERAEAMEDERAEEERKRKEEAEKKHEEDLKLPPPPPPAPVFEPKVSREGPLSSSLRVGRTRTGRNHIDHPVSRRAKYSAAFEDEDEDMEESRAAEQKVLEEAAKKAPAFEIPSSFTFAKETTITHDLARAKEPPIPSLPFSLTKSGLAPTSATAPPEAEVVVLAAVPAPPTPAPALPRISLIPPTPDAVKLVPEAAALPVTAAQASVPAPTPSGIPNFFASSSVFAKSTAFTAVTTPTPSLTVPMAESRPAKAAEPQLSKAGDATPSLFAAPLRPSSAFTTSTPDAAVVSSDPGAPPVALKEAEKPKDAPLSAAPPFTFGTPAEPVKPIPVPSKQPPAEGVAKPATPSNGTPFTLGAPPPAPPPPSATVSTPAALVEAPKSAFTLSQPATAPTSTSAPPTAPSTNDTPKSLFGTPPSATPFTFGQRPGVAPAEGKPALTSAPFSFGTPTAAEKKPATGFTFGTSTASTGPPVSAPSFAFSAAPSGTTAADVSSKPFAFGPATATRPVTPPKAEQEVTMDESPARDMVLNGEGKAPERPTLNFTFNTPSGSALFAQSPATTTAPFSFGAPGATANPFAKEEKKESKPAVSFGGFGQTSSTGFSFGQKPPDSPTTTAPAAAPFSFTQPSPNVAPASPFSFGAAPTSATPFGQSSTASAPSSPSTFNRPTPFTFGTPTTTQPAANPFAFGGGSQPASPAAGSTALPSGTTGNSPFTFGAGTSSTATPAAPFGASTGAAAPTGASLFTMGSAPPPAEGRRIKGLPRRGVRR